MSSSRGIPISSKREFIHEVKLTYKGLRDDRLVDLMPKFEYSPRSKGTLYKGGIFLSI